VGGGPIGCVVPTRVPAVSASLLQRRQLAARRANLSNRAVASRRNVAIAVGCGSFTGNLDNDDGHCSLLSQSSKLMGLGVVAKKVVDALPGCETADAGVWTGGVVGVGPGSDGLGSFGR
jgi:hypothetical protein